MPGSSAELPATPEAPRLARRHLAAVLEQHGCGPDAIDIAALLVSELVTNAFVHAGSAPVLTVTVDGDILVEVTDRSPRHPVAVAADDNASGGRGLALVEALASAWGITVHDDLAGSVGKTVWFRLPPR